MLQRYVNSNHKLLFNQTINIYQTLQSLKNIQIKLIACIQNNLKFIPISWNIFELEVQFKDIALNWFTCYENSKGKLANNLPNVKKNSYINMVEFARKVKIVFEFSAINNFKVDGWMII